MTRIAPMALSFRFSLRVSCAASLGIVVAAALLVPVAHAADKKAPPAPKTPILTPAQLRDCLAQKEKLGKDTDAAVKTKAQVATAKAEIDSTGAALNEQATTLERTDADAVAAYNAKVLERNARIDAYRAEATAYNTDAESVLTSKEAYEKACANRRYDDRDLPGAPNKK